MLRALEVSPASLMFYRDTREKRAGFSLMELAIAIALVLGIMFYMIDGNALFSSSDSMNVKEDMNNLRTYIKTYSNLRKDHQAPASLDDLLVGIPASESSTGRDEPAVVDSAHRDSILDPWGNEYTYTLDAGGRNGTISSSLGGSGEYSVNF